MAGAFAAKFESWCIHQITIEPWMGTTTVDGTPVLGAATVVKCMIVEDNKMVRDSKGDDRVSNTTIYALTNNPIGPFDKITMPNVTMGPINPPIISVRNLSDQYGHSHTEIFL